MAFNIPFVHPRARFFDPNGNPLEFGRVIFYDAGTTTLKTVYSDKTNTTPAPNPHELDADGFVQDGGVWLGEGRYDIVVQRALTIPPTEETDWANYWTMPDIPGSLSEIEGELTTTFVETIQDLRDIAIGTIQLVYVAGYFEAGDTGGGWFIYQPNSVQADDGGAFIAPTGAGAQGRYHRIFEEAYTGAMWGALESNPSPVDANLVNAADYCETVKSPLTLTGQVLELSGNVTLSQNIHLVVQFGAIFNSSTSSVVRLETKSIGFEGQGPLISGNTELFIVPDTPTDVYPDFWGTDDAGMFAELPSHYGSCTLVISRKYDASSLLGSLVLDRLRFEADGDLTINADLILGYPYEFPEGADQLFTIQNFGTANSLTTNYPTVYGHHFSVTPDDNIYQALIDGATAVQTRQGTIIWEGVIGFNNTVVADDTGLVTRVVSRETNLVLVGTENTAFGIVDAGQFQIFDSNSIVNPFVRNSVRGSWFGLYSGMDANEAVEALRRSLDCTFTDNYGVVDYEGINVDLAATVVQSSSTSAKLLKNGNFNEGAGFVGTKLIEFNARVKLTNFDLKGGSIAPFTVTSNCPRFEMRDSEISGSSSFVINAGKTILRSNQISCTGQNQSNYTWIEFNEFSAYYNIVDPVRVLVHGNDWSDGDNTNGNLELSGSVVGYTAYDVRIRNNSFSFPTAQAIPAIKASNNMASFGHVAEVVGNNFSNVWESSTQFTFITELLTKGAGKTNWVIDQAVNQQVSIVLPRTNLALDFDNSNPIMATFGGVAYPVLEPLFYGWKLNSATITPASGVVQLSVFAFNADNTNFRLTGTVNFSWLDDNFSLCTAS